MKPFFTFYGGKYRAAPHYPAPLYETIIEPFAGSAGYAMRYPQNRIILVEKDPAIAALWRYLINTTRENILHLPLDIPTSLDDMDLLPEEKTLIGFWLNKGTASACKTPSAWMRSGIRPNSFWGEAIRYRIASQVNFIKHWGLIEGDYSCAPNIEATWFIDPPYQKAGRLYRYSSKDIDFTRLGEWCKNRMGQVMVCENDGADWLPFIPHRTIKSTEGKHGKKQSKESLYEQYNPINT